MAAYNYLLLIEGAQKKLKTDALKEYFSCACVYTFSPKEDTWTDKQWLTATYQVHAQAYAGIGEGAIFLVDIQKSSFEVMMEEVDETCDDDDDDSQQSHNDDESSVSSCDSESDDDSEGSSDSDSDDELDDDEFIIALDENGKNNEGIEVESNEGGQIENRQKIRGKYSGKPKGKRYKEPLSLTGTRVDFHQTFGKIKSKLGKKERKQNSKSNENITH